MYLLDTDIIIGALARDNAIRQLLNELIPLGVSISSVTLMEVMHGLLFSGAVLSRNRFEEMLLDMPVIPFAMNEARACAAIRAGLQREGKRVRQRSLDLMIAATAQSHNVTLVTRNVADYHNIPGLEVLAPEGRSAT